MCVISRIKYTTLMRTNRRIFFFWVVIFAVIASSFVPGPASSQQPGTGKAAPQKNVPTNVGVSSKDGTATFPDPKRPGKLLYTLRWKDGAVQSGDTGIYGNLMTVWAKLFQGGVSSAILTAPRAEVSSVHKSAVVTGLGGVLVTSLTQKGTQMTADTVVWTASTNQIVATGHVIYHDGKTGAVLTGPRMVFDTRLKSFHTGRGHGTLPG